MNNLLIAVEGIDGSGKTTAVDYVSKALRKNGHSVKVVRAMGTGEIGHVIRELLLKEYFTPEEGSLACALAILDAYKTALLYLDQGHTVIIDRFIGTYYAYNLTANQERLAVSLFDLLFKDKTILHRPPDGYIYLQVTAEQAKERMQARTCLSHFDEASLVYTEHLITGFTAFAGLIEQDWMIIDNSDTLTYLHHQLDAALNRLEYAYA